MPIGPAPTTRMRSSLRGAGAADRVGADRQEFDHRRLIESDSVRRRHVGFRDADVVGHAPVDVHAQDADALAAVGLAAPAGDADAAGKIGDDVNLLADGDRAARSGLRHLARQFVPDDARIFEERMRAFENVKIGAAHAGAADSHQHLTRSRRGSRPVRNGDVAWTVAYQRPHHRPPKLALLYVMDKNLLPSGKSICFLYKIASR